MAADCPSCYTLPSLLPATRWRRTWPFCRRRSAANCWLHSYRIRVARVARRRQRGELIGREHPQKRKIQLLISVRNYSIDFLKFIGRKLSLIFLSPPKQVQLIIIPPSCSIYHNTSPYGITITFILLFFEIFGGQLDYDQFPVIALTVQVYNLFISVSPCSSCQKQSTLKT